MYRTQRLLMLTAALSVVACTPQTVYEPVEVSSDYLVYVPVPNELTDPLPVAVGPLRDCPSVARQRRAALAQCNADRAAVRSLRGTRQPEASPREPHTAPEPTSGDGASDEGEPDRRR